MWPDTLPSCHRGVQESPRPPGAFLSPPWAALIAINDEGPAGREGHCAGRGYRQVLTRRQLATSDRFSDFNQP